MLSQPRSLLRDQPFRNVFVAAAVSTWGTQISFVAVPLVAVIALRADPGQVGLLGVLQTLAFLLVGLPAGAWLDRMRKRPVMVAADLGRAVLLGSVPVAWWLGTLTFAHLYVVVLAVGVATVFFDVASQTYLPSVVGRDRLLAANSRLHSVDAAAGVAGPGVAGLLVQVTAAPVAVAVDAATFLWSAVFLGRVRGRDAVVAPRRDRRLFAEIGEGVRFVGGHPLLRPIAVVGAGTNLFVQLAIVAMPLLFQRVLQLPAGALGLFFTFGGVGVLLGASTAGWLVDRIGEGRALWIVGLAATPFGFLVPLIDRGPWLWVAMCCWLVLTYRIGMNNVVLVSVRQRVTPAQLLSRVNATMRFLMTGVLAVGAALAGVLGQLSGVRMTLWVAAAGLSLGWLPVVASPLRQLGGTADPCDRQPRREARKTTV